MGGERTMHLSIVVKKEERDTVVKYPGLKALWDSGA